MDDDPFDPTEAPPQKQWDFKKAQTRLKECGYTLLAYGPQEALFHRTDAERDKYGLLPDEAIVRMLRKQFDKFLKGLRK